MARSLLLLILIACLSGCGGFIYKVSVFQGNILDAEDIAQLKPGMNKRQVSLILGTPAVANPFRKDRWDYVGSERVRDQTTLKKTLTLVFEDGQLEQVLGDYTVPEFGLVASDDQGDQDLAQDSSG